MAENLPTVQEIKGGAKRYVRELHRLDVRPSARNKALEKIMTQKNFAILLAGFMKKNGIDSIESLADFLYIGEDHIEVLGWLRNPFGGEQEEFSEYLLGLATDE